MLIIKHVHYQHHDLTIATDLHNHTQTVPTITVQPLYPSPWWQPWSQSSTEHPSSLASWWLLLLLADNLTGSSWLADALAGRQLCHWLLVTALRQSLASWCTSSLDHAPTSQSRGSLILLQWNEEQTHGCLRAGTKISGRPPPASPLSTTITTYHRHRHQSPLPLPALSSLTTHLHPHLHLHHVLTNTAHRSPTLTPSPLDARLPRGGIQGWW